MSKDVLNVMMERRSTRKYSGKPIPEELLKRILSAGLLAPTSMNKKTCQFYVVKDPAVLKALSKAKKMGAGMLASCNAAIVVAADGSVSDVWVEDCSIALSFMMLEATAEGVGNCWCQMRNRSSLLGKDAEINVRQALGIEDSNLRISGVLALGLPESVLPARSLDDVDWNKVHNI